MMKLGIDARFFGTLGKGLGRYTQKLIEHLEKIDTENQYYVFLRRENFEEYVPKNPNFQKVLADFQWYSFAEQLGFPWLLRKYELDLMHFPHFNVPLLYFGKFVITIHDLILLHFPTKRATTLQPIWYKLKFLAYRATIFSAIVRCQKIITVSEFTKKDILGEYPSAKNKIFVTYEACEDLPQNKTQNDAQILQKYGIMKPYLLYVGNAYPHKNLEKLIEAFALVLNQKKELNLVLIGKEDYFYKRLKKFVEKNKIRNVNFPGFVPDDELQIFYANATLYVFPSLYEGFGLPPLEAMKNGAPVISSMSACMPEILGESAHFMNAENEKEIAKVILQVMQDEKLKAELILKGYAQVKKYSWEKMARETLKIYQDKNI